MIRIKSSFVCKKSSIFFGCLENLHKDKAILYRSINMFLLSHLLYRNPICFNTFAKEDFWAPSLSFVEILVVFFKLESLDSSGRIYDDELNCCHFTGLKFFLMCRYLVLLHATAAVSLVIFATVWALIPNLHMYNTVSNLRHWNKRSTITTFLFKRVTTPQHKLSCLSFKHRTFRHFASIMLTVRINQYGGI